MSDIQGRRVVKANVIYFIYIYIYIYINSGKFIYIEEVRTVLTTTSQCSGRQPSHSSVYACIETPSGNFPPNSCALVKTKPPSQTLLYLPSLVFSNFLYLSLCFRHSIDLSFLFHLSLSFAFGGSLLYFLQTS